MQTGKQSCFRHSLACSPLDFAPFKWSQWAGGHNSHSSRLLTCHLNITKPSGFVHVLLKRKTTTKRGGGSLELRDDVTAVTFGGEWQPDDVTNVAHPSCSPLDRTQWHPYSLACQSMLNSNAIYLNFWIWWCKAKGVWGNGNFFFTINAKRTKKDAWCHLFRAVFKMGTHDKSPCCFLPFFWEGNVIMFIPPVAFTITMQWGAQKPWVT